MPRLRLGSETDTEAFANGALKLKAPPNSIVKSRIPGSQTGERAEAFAILAALMLNKVSIR